MQASNATYQLNALCFNALGNTPTEYNSCLYVPDPIASCAEYYNNSLTYCTAL